jgi:hypothetical protein
MNSDDEAVVYGITTKSGKMVFCNWFAANSVSDAAKVLIKISIKGRNKYQRCDLLYFKVVPLIVNL